MSEWIDPEAEAIARARAWHWTEDAPVYRIDVDDPDLPDGGLIACGQFVSLTVELAGGLRGVRVLHCQDPDAYVAYDPQNAQGRLYLVCPEDVCAAAARAFWRPRGDIYTLEAVAAQVGGWHVADYPDVLVQPIGAIQQIEYWARKYGHGQGAEKGAVFYHPHEAVLPWLAVSADGRLWYAGGDYDATDLRGIVG